MLFLQPPPTPPARDVAKPGVVATGQRTTPAGMQTVFAGRVGGVRFDSASRTVWVAVPGSVYRLDWNDGRIVSRQRFDGRPGVFGVAVDPPTGRALVTTVGRLADSVATNRLPGSAPLASRSSIAQLAAFEADTGAGRARTTSGAVGDFLAGAPAAARVPNASGRRVAVVPLPANDALAVLDADALTPIASVPLGVVPVAAALARDGSRAYVTNLGGAKPTAGQRAARQCCDPRAESVRIDARGIASPGSVTRVDVAARRVTRTLTVGRHPTAIAWDEARERLYVADGNDDAVHVIDTRADTVAAVIAVAPFRAARRIGLAPTALAIAPDGRTLYVALGGANAVAVYDVSGARASLRGLIPTGWYPSSLDASADGRWLAVGTLYGVGSGEGEVDGKRGGYVHAVRGSVHVVAVPNASELAAYTVAVAQNDGLPLATSVAPAEAAGPRAVAARPVPERPGEPSPIEHVVFIIRENRTYDQILGDLGRGDGDSSLVMYGRDVTPNAHALAEQFVTLDHFFASGGNSADGHQWLTQANETEYPMWPLYYGRSYPSEGNDPLAYSSGGFLWEAAQAKGKTVTIFGEYAPAPSDSVPSVRRELMADWDRHAADDPATRSRHFRTLLGTRYRTRSAIPSLDRALVREYPGWTQEVPDVVKAEVILDHLRGWTAAGKMPHLVMVILPSDHTVGTTPGWCVPKACVADNDLALGRIVEGLSRSPFWPKMAILVVEDDAQNGVDHVDGHRTVALAISPWAKRGVVDPTPYVQPSMVKTIELMLGLPALSVFDLTATDMRASFLAPDEKPDLTPYSAIVPRQSLSETNARVGAIIGPDAAARRRAALASSRMNFFTPDAAPSERLNAILWHDARGWKTPMPAVKRALFFPLSVDLDDDEREERRKP
ncbi:phosphoesterase (plasmid) [Gemmatirosa kalamazoonensis]|uniref:Phosphoesterase n=1 Tax=Gemmatirosa kalamazoonensis TaxID=861299 RepID=W0RU26_9BACT|nr:bifunctional YncE family protein/alkaline phosphatase family protein [Gemmatirosa kalamazoonensis]AHG93810.1 phosphoesterase [Gemmatirosa kalamazoonensis]